MDITPELIVKYRKSNKLTQEDLARILGVSKNTIYNYERGGNIPETKITILGDMIFGLDSVKFSKLESEIEVQKIHNPPYRESVSDDEVPVYDIDAAANLKTLFDTKQPNILDTLRIPNLPKCDGAVYVRGDSMYPLLKSGDIVAYKQISGLEYLVYGEMYLIDFNLNGDFYLSVKYVAKSEKENYIKLVSYNTHHEPMDIPISSINAIAMIKASVRINTMM